MDMRSEARQMKLQAPVLAATTVEQRNAALLAIAQALEAHKGEIFAANQEEPPVSDRCSPSADE